VHESSWSGRMDGRTQTLKSARAIDAINGCVRLVAGKIDDEHRGAHSYLYLSNRREPASRRATAAPHRAARRAERMEQRPKYRFLGPYAAVRSMLVSAPCPRPIRAKRLSKHRRRARDTPRSCTQPRLRRPLLLSSLPDARCFYRRVNRAFE